MRLARAGARHGKLTAMPVVRNRFRTLSVGLSPSRNGSMT
jgi:hypothetical protein